MTTQIIVNTIIAGSTYALVAIGFNLLYSTTHFFNLAHGVALALGGYAFLLFTSSLNIHPILAIVLTIIFTGFVGLLSEKLIYKKLREKKSTPMVMMVTSIGLMLIIQSIISIYFGNQFRILGLKYNLSNYVVFGTHITAAQLFIIGALIIITVITIVILKWTKFGIQVRAVGDSDSLAEMVGIDTKKIIASVFFFASAIAGFTGILVGLDAGIEPLMGFSWLIKGVIAAIIGTVGLWYGGLVGGFILAFIEQAVVWQFSGEWKDVVSFMILMIFLLFRPNGLFSSSKNVKH